MDYNLLSKEQLLEIIRGYEAKFPAQNSGSVLGELKTNNVPVKTPREERKVPKVRTPRQKKRIPKLAKVIADKRKKNENLYVRGKRFFVYLNGGKRLVIYDTRNEFVLVDPHNKSEEFVRFKIYYKIKDGKVVKLVERLDDTPIEGYDFIYVEENGNRNTEALLFNGNVFKSQNNRYYEKLQSRTSRRYWYREISDPNAIDTSSFTMKVDGIQGAVTFKLRNVDIPLTSINNDNIDGVMNNKRRIINTIKNIIEKELPKIPDFKTNEGNVSFNLAVRTYMDEIEGKSMGEHPTWFSGIHISIPFNEQHMVNEMERMIIKFSISDKDIAVTQIVVVFKQILAGGCLDSKSHDEFVRMPFKDGIKLEKPITRKGKFNNCFFYCFKPEFKAKKIRLCASLCNQYRRRYGLEDNTKIDIVTGPKMIKDILGLNIAICNQRMDYFGECSDEKFDVNIMLESEHYVRVKFVATTKICEYCGESYKTKHDKIACKARCSFQYNKKTGNKIVLSKKITPKGWEGINEMQHIIHYDIESYRIEHGVSVANAIGWIYRGQYKYLYGEDCIEKFVDMLLTDKTYEEACFLNAFNGSSFDHLFVINIAEKRLGLDKINPIKGVQGIISGWIGNIKLVDIRLHLEGSLKKCLENFGCSVRKDTFDHEKNGKNLDEKTKADLLAYLEIDVRGLEELSCKLHDEYMTNFGSSWVHTISTSQMAYSVWKNSIPNGVEVPIPNATEYEFMRKGIYGGRTSVHRKYFESKEWNSIKTKKINSEGIVDMTKEEFDSINDFLLDLDVNSLYPEAMLQNYPIGEMKHTLKYMPGKMGMYKINYIPNKKLLIPVLPKHEASGLKWNLEDGDGVYSSVDIETARKYGYEIEVLNGVYWEESQPIFKDYIEETYDKKKKAKKGTPAYQVAKLFMNGLYGKCLQKPRTEKTFFVSKSSDWNDIIPKYYLKYIDTETFSNVWIITAEAKDPKIIDKAISKPTELGIFVLSHSRRIMMNYFDKLGTLYNKENQLYYTDTDSIQIHGSQLNFNLGNEIGMLSDDLSSGGKKSKIIRGMWIAPKLYMLEYLQLQEDGKTVLLKGHKVGKGVKKVNGSIPISVEHYIDMCNGNSFSFENKDIFKKNFYKLNSKQIAKGIDTFSVVIGNQKKEINRKLWDGRIFDKFGNSFPVGYIADNK